MGTRVIGIFLLALMMASCAYAPSAVFTETVATYPDPRYSANIKKDPVSGEYQLNLGSYDIRTDGFEPVDGAPVAMDQIADVFDLGPSIAYIVEGMSPRCGRRAYIFDLPKIQSSLRQQYFPPFGRCGSTYKFVHRGDTIVATETDTPNPMVITYRFGTASQQVPLAVVERRHEEALRQAQRRKAEAAAQAAIQAKYEPYVDRLIQEDAAGWIVNRYDSGSPKNINITMNGRRVVGIRADYTYNNGDPGWVRIDLHGASPCLEYWDNPGVCRAPDPQRAARFIALLAAFEAAQANAAPAASSSGDSTPNLGKAYIEHNITTCGDLAAWATGCE